MKKQRLLVSTTHIILLSFLVAILIDSVLLVLPISSADGKATPFLDALFTATTSTCVTGLVVTPTVSSWSVFGQVIILLLIQIGGLGVITIMSGLMILLHKKMGIRQITPARCFQLKFSVGTYSVCEKSCCRYAYYREHRCSALYDGFYT